MHSDLRALVDRIPRQDGARERYARDHADAILAGLTGVAERPDRAEPETLCPLLELTHLAPLREKPETRVLLARLATVLPGPPEGRIAHAIAGCTRLAFGRAQAYGPPEAGRLLAIAAGRDEVFSFGNRLWLALDGLPESVDVAARLLAEATAKDAPTALEMQAAILRRPADEARRRAIGAFYRGPGAQHALTTLPPLAQAGALRAVLPQLATAAVHAGGELHRALATIAPGNPSPELRTLLTWIAAAGDLAARDAAVAAERAIPAGRSHAVAAVNAALAEAPPDPWTFAERLAVARAIAPSPTDGPAATPGEVLALCRRAADAPALTGASLARLAAALTWIGAPERLAAPDARALLLDLVPHPTLLVSVTAQGGLLRALEPGRFTLSSDERRKVADAALRGPKPVTLALARLGLPFTLADWRSLRSRKFHEEDVSTWDQTLAFALPPAEARPVLEALYADATPNQRRALARVAPLDAAPGHVGPLLDLAARLDAHLARALVERVAATRPRGAMAALLALARHRASPEDLRIFAVTTASELAGPTELDDLAALESEPGLRAAAESAVRAARERLVKAGVRLPEGGLALASEVGGGLAIAPSTAGTVALAGSEDSGANTPISSAMQPNGGRALAPPPRFVPPHVALALLVLADNRWGVLWLNLVVVSAISFTEPGGNPGSELLTLLGMIALFLANHWIAETFPLLRTLRSGLLSVGTVSAKPVVGSRTSSTPTWQHTVRYLGDDGAVHTVRVDRPRRVPTLGDEALEPLLVRSDAAGHPVHAAVVDALRVVRVRADGGFALAWSAWAWLVVGLCSAGLMLSARV